jgi:hypothetical protein
MLVLWSSRPEWIDQMADISNASKKDTKEQPAHKPIIVENVKVSTVDNQGKIEKRKHLGLDALAIFIAILAFGAAGYQGWVARDTEQRSLRAYIFVDTAHLGINNSRLPDVNVTIKNFGSTPASGFQHWACAFVRPTPQPNKGNKFSDISSVEAPHTIITPQGTKIKSITGWCEFNLPTTPISEAERAEIKKGTKSVYAVGKIMYEDAFGVRRITKYSRYWNDLLGTANTDDKEGNCSDEHCQAE